MPMISANPLEFYKRCPSADGTMLRCDTLDLERVIYYHPDAVFVTDGQGIVLLANPACEALLDFHFDRGTRPHVRDLVKSGVYTRSTTIEALEKRTTVTSMYVTHKGVQVMSTSRPVCNEQGEIEFVITSSRPRTVVERFLSETLIAEQARIARYKTAMSYLGKRSQPNHSIIHHSQPMRTAVSLAATVAKMDSAILLSGESGTGKELVAGYIHQRSARSQEPFIPINCAAIPGELLESELFGYVRGAFSGASAQGKPGLLEVADGGTLFLDEIGDLPLCLQPKLLRVLETGELQPVGSTERRRVDVRLISATNKDLWDMVQHKLFRADLYFRLNVVPIYLPPLRERPEDLLALADSFLEDFNHRNAQQKRFSECAKRALLAYHWPGNVRELRNVVERLSLVAAEPVIDAPACRGALHVSPPLKREKAEPVVSLREFRQRSEAAYLRQTLEHFAHNVARTAEALGIHRVALHRKIRELGLRPADAPPEEA